MIQKSLRIMHVVQSMNCGGQEKMLISLAEHQRSMGHHSSICVFEGPGELSDDVEGKQIPIHYLYKKPGVQLSLVFKLRQLLRKQRIDVLHAHNMGPAFYGTIAARLGGAPFILVTRHNKDAKHWNAMLWQMTNIVVAVSRDAKKALLQYNMINPKKVRVIYNGIDVDKYRHGNDSSSSIRSQLQLSDKDIVICSVGRLCYQKDYFTLLDALKIVLSKCPCVKLLIIGDGPLKNELHDYAQKLGIAESVKFLGLRNDIPALLKMCRLFVLSSVSEGMPIALLEAMACSLPCVVTGVGGNVEVVVDGISGYIVPPKNPELLSDRIIDILKDEQLAQRIGVAAYHRVKEQFTLQRMSEEYFQLYALMIGDKSLT